MVPYWAGMTCNNKCAQAGENVNCSALSSLELGCDCTCRPLSMVPVSKPDHVMPLRMTGSPSVPTITPAQPPNGDEDAACHEPSRPVRCVKVVLTI